MPGTKATGRNTAISTSEIATIGAVTSRIASTVASCGPSPRSSISRDTFSTTTIASSTTRPIASTSPNRVSVLIEKPSSAITAKVPTSDTGTVIAGIRVARKLSRNTNTTRNTSSIASKSVQSTSRIDSVTKRVGS